MAGVCDVQAVADYLLWFSEQHGDWLTNLKLQKLLYYAQAWHLANFGQPLFDDPIEAWVHGPVVYSVWKRFEGCGRSFLPEIGTEPELDPEAKKFLQEVLDVYGCESAFALEQRTHSERPWQVARGDLLIDAPSRNVISIDEMKNYYGDMLHRADEPH